MPCVATSKASTQKPVDFFFSRLYRKSQRVSIHMVFVTNKLVKSKPGLICSILSILQPCTAAFRYFFALPTSRTISHLYNRPRKPSIEDIKPQSIAPRASREDRCEKRVKLTLFGPAPTRQLRRRPETGGRRPWHARTAYCLSVVVQQETQS